MKKFTPLNNICLGLRWIKSKHANMRQKCLFQLVPVVVVPPQTAQWSPLPILNQKFEHLCNLYSIYLHKPIETKKIRKFRDLFAPYRSYNASRKKQRDLGTGRAVLAIYLVEVSTTQSTAWPQRQIIYLFFYQLSEKYPVKNKLFFHWVVEIVVTNSI